MEREDSFKDLLKTVQESILDEEKIVTYVSLSKDLAIHLNTSKQVLQSFVEKIRVDLPKIKLNVNYIISGAVSENRARTTVCMESELVESKKTFSTIYFEHIYSVSKGDPCIDPAAYLLVNKLDDFCFCPGLIKSTECLKRTSDELGSLKTTSRESIPIKENKIIKTESKIGQDTQHKSNMFDSKTSIKNGKSQLDSKIKTEVISPKKDLSDHKKNNNSKTQKKIAGFFNKANGTTPNKAFEGSKHENEVKHGENIQVKEEKMDIDKQPKLNKHGENIQVKEEKMDIHKQPKLKNDIDLKNTSNSTTKNKVLNQIKKSSKVDKKRKRVLHVLDSDSDEENDPFIDKQESNHESDDEIPPTPSNSSVKITSGIVNPKKRRKLVDKTYTDEDGFILTKKEEVYESCSENEEEKMETEDIQPTKVEKSDSVKVEKTSPIKKKISPKGAKKKISPPQKGKQSTLTSFFKKI